MSQSLCSPLTLQAALSRRVSRHACLLAARDEQGIFGQDCTYKRVYSTQTSIIRVAIRRLISESSVLVDITVGPYAYIGTRGIC